MLAETAPESLPAFFAAVDSIAACLRDTPITEDELIRARAPVVESLRRSQADNDYWLGQLADVGRNARDLSTQIRTHVADYEAVTPADIQRLARQYLTPQTAWRLTVTSDNPAAPAAAAPAAAQ